MIRLPSMPFFVSDYLGSGWVRMLSFEERGVYCELLFLQWQEESLPPDETSLVRLLGIDRRRFRGIWKAIGSKFQLTPEGKLQNRAVAKLRRKHQKRQPIPKTTRKAVLSVGRCEYCGAKNPLEVDHIYPWALGGGDHIGNLQALCKPCNASKGKRVFDGR